MVPARKRHDRQSSWQRQRRNRGGRDRRPALGFEQIGQGNGCDGGGATLRVVVIRKVAYDQRGRGPVALVLDGFLRSFQWAWRLRPAGRRSAPLATHPPAWIDGVAPHKSRAACAGRDARVADPLLHLDCDLIGERQRRCRGTDGRRAIRSVFDDAAGRTRDVEHDSAAVLSRSIRRREGLQYARPAPWAANKPLGAQQEGPAPDVHYPGDPTDEAIDQILAPLASLPQRKALVDAYAPGSIRSAAGIEASLSVARCRRGSSGAPDPILAPKPETTSTVATEPVCDDASRARSCSSRRSSRT